MFLLVMVGGCVADHGGAVGDFPALLSSFLKVSSLTCKSKWY